MEKILAKINSENLNTMSYGPRRNPRVNNRASGRIGSDGGRESKEERVREAARILEEMGFEMEREPDEDEREGDDEEFDSEMDTSRKGVAHLEAIIQALEARPNDLETLAAAKSEIRQLYLSNGGLPFHTGSALPRDLNDFDARELSNILQNMMIASVRSKSGAFLDRALNLAQNMIQIASLQTGIEFQGSATKEIANDDLLKECLVNTFIGGMTKVNPLIGLCVCSASHFSNLYINYTYGAIERQRRLATDQQNQPPQPGQPEQPRPQGYVATHILL